MNFTPEEIVKMIEESPEECLITGLSRINSYVFDEGVVYGYDKPLDAYTLPFYDSDNMNFTRVKIDMDNDFEREFEDVCELCDLLDRSNFKEIVEFYNISEEDIERAKTMLG